MAEKPPALSAEARAALAAYCEATPMPKAARERVHARLSKAGPGRPAWLWIGVGALAAGLLLWGGLGIRDTLRATEPEANGNQAPLQAPRESGEATAVVPAEPSATTTRRPAAPDASAERGPVPPEATPQPSASAPPLSTGTPARRKPRSAPPATPERQPAASQLGAENRLIARTWEHVRGERYVEARQSLAKHATEFPDGVLAPERDALFVIVACLEHPESAAGKADAYAAQGRNSLLAKVRSACDERKSAEQ